MSLFLVLHAIPGNCRSQPAGDELKCAVFIQFTRVIVNEHRQQAGSLYVGATPADQNMQKVPNNHSPYFTADDAPLATGLKAHVRFVLNYPGRGAEKLSPSG